MRTTLDIADDVLQAAKELAERQKSTAGKIISDLARSALQPAGKERATVRNGIPVFTATGEIVTLEKVQQIADQEGI